MVDRRDNSAARAFTLIEVMVVVVIAGIAALIVMPAMIDPGSMRTQAASRAVIADMLFAQNEAIAHQAERRVAFDVDAGVYRVTDGAGTPLAASWKTGGTYEVNFSTDGRFQGVSIAAADFNGQAVLVFDAMGSPASGGQVELRSGNERYRVTVAAFTGRITIEPVSGG